MTGRLLLATLIVSLPGLIGVSRAAAQAEGVVAGQVRQKESRAGLPAAEVLVDDRVGAVADTAGRYRVAVYAFTL